MRKLLVLGVASALAVLTATSALAGSTEQPDDGFEVESREVTFTVDNLNRSNLECPTDGETYEIRGQIFGPEDAIDDAESASLYLHGLELGQYFWTTDVEGASFVDRLAADGHVSVVIDRLGYDSSDKPNGFDSCVGGQADIAQQILHQLRSGDYVTRGHTSSPSFDEVVLGGHSVGGLITELTANSFDGATDGIVVMSYSSFILSDAAEQAAMQATAACKKGGASTEGSAPAGYAFFSPSVAGFQDAFFLSTDPALVDLATELRNRNPCGDIQSFATGQQVNADNAAHIDVPALVLIGQQDAIFPEPSGPREQELIQTGSDDVELEVVAPSSHSVTTEEPAPQVAERVSRWLDEHGFGRS